jgi:16S rRNA (cytidine1402-2'-O)-methyltransferase
LVLVATPIGNLGDLSPRAVQELAAAAVVYCEDTRRTKALLSHAGLTGVRLQSLHGHNEAARLPDVLERLSAGDTVAVVSDAGTPAVSDPGARVACAAAAAGATVTVVPGASAVLAGLVVSGLATDRFCFEGFMPRRGPTRRRRLEALAHEERTTVLFEAPGRVAATLADIAEVCGADRLVAVARELTKLHEEVWRGSAADAATVFGAHEVRGEVVVIVAGAESAQTAPADEDVNAALGAQLAAGASVRDAAAAVAEDLGVTRRHAYALALALYRNGRP